MQVRKQQYFVYFKRRQFTCINGNVFACNTSIYNRASTKSYYDYKRTVIFGILVVFYKCVCFQSAPIFHLTDEDRVVTSMCQCQDTFRPEPSITIQIVEFLEYLHLNFVKKNGNVNLMMSYDFIPSQHFPGSANNSMTLKPDRPLQVGKTHSSFKCTADEKLELNNSVYHMEVTINHVHLQAFDISGGQFSPGKRKHILSFTLLLRKTSINYVWLLDPSNIFTYVCLTAVYTFLLLENMFQYNYNTCMLISEHWIETIKVNDFDVRYQLQLSAVDCYEDHTTTHHTSRKLIEHVLYVSLRLRMFILPEGWAYSHRFSPPANTVYACPYVRPSLRPSPYYPRHNFETTRKINKKTCR